MRFNRIKMAHSFNSEGRCDRCKVHNREVISEDYCFILTEEELDEKAWEQYKVYYKNLMRESE